MVQAKHAAPPHPQPPAPPPTRFGRPADAAQPKPAPGARHAPPPLPPPVHHHHRAVQAMMDSCGDRFCQKPGCDGKHPPTPPRHYSQSTDPSVTPFLRTGEQTMGERALEKQRKKKTPTAEEVRVAAVKTADRRAGSGMHEIWPTDSRGEAVTNPELIPYQSGARLATDLTLFDAGNGNVAAHTGAFPKTSGRGSTHTSGQKEAHDKLRRYKPKGNTPQERNIDRLRDQISNLADGQQILDADNITGAHPNSRHIGILESPNGISKPNRKKLAMRFHQRREKLKRRLNTLAKHHGMDPPASPPREEPGGPSGGGYTYDVQGPPSPYPYFTQTDPVLREADEYAWATAPGRTGAEYQTSKECGLCRHLNDNRASDCWNCGCSL